ncbi:unnamed protein product [Orchesella dallaii]|uniref:Protein cereblon n=1 Tax=Orchesella dallaii TaxID=48710 RepID=A0ABP1Q4J9_9HEXA
MSTMDMPSGNVVYKGALGTLAEIYEYQEESDAEGPGSMSSSFALKAKGRQRFNVIEVRRQADGNLMGKVKVRAEIRLEPFVLNMLLPGVSRCFLPKRTEELEEETASLTATVVPVVETTPVPQIRSGSITRFTLATRRDSVVSTVSTVGPDKDLIVLKAKIQDRRKRLKYYSALTPQPYFVYEQYDETVLVEKVHRLLKTELRGLTESGGKIPVDASDLSFWLAQNLTMDDAYRTKVLKMDSPVQRLRYELELLARTTKVISCRNCQTNIADHSQIFSMSIEGPQATYVNPHGFVHETLTVYKTKELMTRGLPSVESSWFPGYSWTIVECKRCKSHIGWKFQAVGLLKPSRFWGLARRSVIFKYDFGSDSDLQESLDSHTTPPNSANSEAYSTVALF